MPKPPPEGPEPSANFDQIRSAESRQQLIAGFMAALRACEIAGPHIAPDDHAPKEASNA
jgi:hypothetical protein